MSSPEAFDIEGAPVTVGCYLKHPETGAYIGTVFRIGKDSRNGKGIVDLALPLGASVWADPGALAVMKSGDPAWPVAPSKEAPPHYDDDDGVEDLIRVAREAAEEYLRNEYPVGYRNLMDAIERVELNR